MVKIGFKGTDFSLSVDTDKDGVASAEFLAKLENLLKLGKKGEFKKFSFEMVGSSIVFNGDLNGDGGQDLVFQIYGLETADEVMALVKK